MDAISLKLDGHMLKNVDSALKANNYSTRTEFIRDAIRDKLTELEKKQALARLVALRGSLKGKARMTDEEARDAVAGEWKQKFGLD